MVSKYPRADYICIDSAEARLAARNQHAETPLLVEELSRLIGHFADDEFNLPVSAVVLEPLVSALGQLAGRDQRSLDRLPIESRTNRRRTGRRTP